LDVTCRLCAPWGALDARTGWSQIFLLAIFGILKTFLKHPIVISILSCLILTPIGSAIYDHTKNIPILTEFILKPLSELWRYLVFLITFKIEVWVIIVSCAIIFGVVKILKTARQDAVNADFLTYKQDRLKKWLWSWEYKYDTVTKQYSIINLMPVCERCNLTMRELSFANVIEYKCPKCDAKINNVFDGYIESKGDVQTLITHNVHNDLYPKN